MLHQYKVEFNAGNHKGGKTYISRLLSQTKEALMKANDGEAMRPAMEVIAKEVGLAKEGITAEYFDIMCSKYSSGVDDRVKYLFRKIGRYVQDNGCWPSKMVLRHWPEYIAMKGHHVKHPEAAYMHHRDYSKKEKPKGNTLAEVESILEIGKLEKQIHTNALVQKMAKETKTTKEAYSHLSKECKRLRDVLMMLESRVLTLEESNDSALAEVRELYGLIDIATAPTKAAPAPKWGLGLIRNKGGDAK